MHIKRKGFSIIELMIIVAIVGILASLALAAYSTHTIKSKVANAIVQLQSLAEPLRIKFNEQGGTFACLSVGGNQVYAPYLNNVNWLTGDAGQSMQVYGNLTNIDPAVNGQTIWIVMQANGTNFMSTCCGVRTDYYGTYGVLLSYLPSTCKSACANPSLYLSCP